MHALNRRVPNKAFFGTVTGKHHHHHYNLFRDLLPPRLPLFSCIGTRARIASKEHLPHRRVIFAHTNTDIRTRDMIQQLIGSFKLTSLLLQRVAPLPVRYERETSKQGRRYPRVTLSLLRKNSAVAQTRAFTIHPAKTKQKNSFLHTATPGLSRAFCPYTTTQRKLPIISKLCRQAAEGTERDTFTARCQ